MTSPIRLGLIGCGGIVQKTHAYAYHSLSKIVKVSAIADVVPVNLETVGQDFNVLTHNRYIGYQDMLVNADIDAVE